MWAKEKEGRRRLPIRRQSVESFLVGGKRESTISQARGPDGKRHPREMVDEPETLR